MTTGKFSDDLCAKLYELSLDGGPDDEYGDCSEAPCRWWGLMLNVTEDDLDPSVSIVDAERIGSFILTEDSQGFVDYETYPTAGEARENFDRIVKEVMAEMHTYHDEHDDECSLCEETEV